MLDHGSLLAHHPMLSPNEYLTALRQLSLLNNLVAPVGQLPAVPSITAAGSAPAIPIIAAVPPTPSECGDIISAVASSPLSLGVAAAVAAVLLLTYLIRKHGPHIMQWFRNNAQQFVARIRAKLKQKRTTYLLPAAQTLVMG